MKNLLAMSNLTLAHETVLISAERTCCFCDGVAGVRWSDRRQNCQSPVQQVRSLHRSLVARIVILGELYIYHHQTMQGQGQHTYTQSLYIYIVILGDLYIILIRQCKARVSIHTHSHCTYNHILFSFRTLALRLCGSVVEEGRRHGSKDSGSGVQRGPGHVLHPRVAQRAGLRHHCFHGEQQPIRAFMVSNNQSGHWW